METISTVVNTASKAIWGDQTATTANETGGSEPVSGLQGKGTATEPYDQGNAPNPSDPVGKVDRTDTAVGTEASKLDVSAPSTTNTIEPKTTELPIRTAKAPETDALHEPTPSTAIDPVKADEPSKSQIPTNPTASALEGEPKPLENTEGTGVTGASAQKYEPKGSDIVPSESSKNTGVAPSSGAVHPETQQGADRPHHAPDSTGVEAVKAKKEDAEATMHKRDPNDHSGEPMRMHNAPGDVPATQEERRESKVGNPGGQEHGTEPKGTGEKHVKSTGLATDGGDFDASKPGAGREADRLLEQKGIHRDEKGNMEGGTDASPGSPGKDKVSKMHKLKEKLHIGHKDK
ncbi:unnamed protein product [Periconia digitata]|uniref:Uncharacterized protein n=1 Tax=Periconia digitata TaxID=1303443 RepID=A0A9W4UAU3_9PLEO|nr:unnamed protein product [Periconia digitata]